jgi:hypothetical protein
MATMGMKMATVTWRYSSGEVESFTAYCIRDARDLWDKLAAIGTAMISARP